MMKAFLLASLLVTSVGAQAMDLDWSGQFRSEFIWIRPYTMNSEAFTPDPAKPQDAYTVSGANSTSARWETLFMRLKPKLVVNDNVYIKSEWWVGDPIYGSFGDAAPYERDRRRYDSTFSRGSFITAQRFWAEFLSDFGTVQVGRVPLHYGLGVVWNDGNGLWDHYQSTGDALRVISKFGAFTFIPSFILYSTGNTFGGNCDVTGTGCAPNNAGTSAGAVREYSLIFKYENMDEDFEGGVNFVKRLADGASYYGPQGYPVGMNYNVWDIYGKKNLGVFSIGGEFPIVTGQVGGDEYHTYAAALEGEWRMSDRFSTNVRAGHAPGQPGSTSGGLNTYRAFYFHPNYKLGNIMFNYQLRNLSGLHTQNDENAKRSNFASPYDNPITNANYLSVMGNLSADKWKFYTGIVYAKASTTAKAGEKFFNSWNRQMSTTTAAVDQGSSLGWEWDLGTTLNWDETFSFGVDLGLYFPGNYYKFSGLDNENKTSTVFGTAAKIGVNF